MKHCIILSAVLLVLFAGCGILKKEHPPVLTGTWTGKGIVGHQGVRQEWDITLILREDGTLSLYYAKGKAKITFNGNYTADLSVRPARFDIRNFAFPKSSTFYCCLGIAEFPGANAMNLCGSLGQCGRVTRPVKFDRTPVDNHQLYFELKREAQPGAGQNR